MRKPIEQDIRDCPYCREKMTGAEIRGIYVCANHLAIWAMTEAKDIGEEKDYGRCDLCEVKAIGVAHDFTMAEKVDVEWRLCREHMRLVGCLDLPCDDVKEMRSKHGVTFLTHDDYYDENGMACQPRSSK